MEQPLAKTPLYDDHTKLNAKIIEFGSWLMPVSYDGVLAEHHFVRSSAGLFDVSHMGEIRVTGTDAANFLQSTTINNVDKLPLNHGQYSAICNEQGGLIDDIFVYKLGVSDFLVCVNASNASKDYKWFKEHSLGYRQLQVTDESSLWSQLAIQGPKSFDALKKILSTSAQRDLDRLEYTQVMWVTLHGQRCLFARTGYTGEKGCEIFIPNGIASKVWNDLLEMNHGTLQPIGLGARDTLRLESCFLLYGNDINESTSPLEAGIEWVTKLNDKDFIGKAALMRQKETGVPNKLVAFTMVEQGIPRHDMPVLRGDTVIGKVTSGSVLPSLNSAGGMAMISATELKSGDEIVIDIRGKKRKAQIVKKPFYQSKAKT